MAQDDTFWNAVVVTMEYVVINIGLQTILALLIAVLMQRLTQSTFVRSIVLTPYLVSNVVAAMLWLWILDNTLGITNQLLESLTGSAVDFFSSSMAIPTIAIINGPVNATRVLQYYIYDMAFGRFQFGYASAMAVGLLLVLAAITILQYRMTRAGETDLD